MVKYWFKRKRYGYGWVPASSEGWVITILYALGIIMVSVEFQTFIETKPLEFGFFVLLWTLSLIAICVHKGEKPKWQWGEKKR